MLQARANVHGYTTVGSNEISILKTNYLLPQPYVEQIDLSGNIYYPEKYIISAFTARMNVLRFFAICSIVWGHSLGGGEKILVTNSMSLSLQTGLIEMGRIGTVIFFMISGYFLADKIHTYNISSYLRYRSFTLIIPWLSFLSLFVIIQMTHILTWQEFTKQGFLPTLQLFIDLFKAFIFHAAYWFIPVAILSACLLIAFKRYLNKPWFMFVLLGITLFYSVNLYHGWISANHTKAFLGYIFFMWIGIQVKDKIQFVRSATARIPWIILLPLLLFLMIAACMEGTNLKNHFSADPFASIRFSNWLLSTGIFFAFLKSNRMAWINCLKPQCYVFGVYLIHCIVITELAPFIDHLYKQPYPSQFLPQVLLIPFLIFTVALGTSYLLAIGIKNSPMKFIMGCCKH